MPILFACAADEELELNAPSAPAVASATATATRTPAPMIFVAFMTPSLREPDFDEIEDLLADDDWGRGRQDGLRERSRGVSAVAGRRVAELAVRFDLRDRAGSRGGLRAGQDHFAV